MHAVSISCPECNARLTVPADRDVVTCEYCATTSHVRRRTGFFERVEPPPPAVPPGQPRRPVVVQQHSRRWLVGFTVVPLVLTLLSGVISMLVARGHSGATGAISAVVNKIASTSSNMSWQGHGPPILRDVNGDGLADIIGRVRFVLENDTIALAAFDARSGDKLWMSETVGTYTDTYQGKLALLGETLLLSDTRGALTAFSVRDGKQRWSTSLGERTKTICRPSSDVDASGATALVQTTDEAWQRVDLATGERSAQSGEPTCVKAATDDKEGGPPDVVIVDAVWSGSVPRELEGMSVDSGISLLPAGPYLALGNRTPGTRVPMLARYEPAAPVPDDDDDDAQPGRRRRARTRDDAPPPRLLWKTVVPGVDPLTVSEGAPELAALTSQRVAVAYELASSRGVRVAAFAVADGSRLWETAIPEQPGTVLAGMAASESHVFVSLWGRLVVFDAATGALAHTIGRQ